ncbi:hypothetical protein JCM6882_005078 [Rhodosporidiobolus microsporus]
MTVAVFKPCALCGEVTSKRCNACKESHFCSMAHLQLDEVKVLDWRSKRAHLVVGKEEVSPSGVVRTRQLQLYEGSLQKVCSHLATTPCPIAEPTRSVLLLFLRQSVFSTESVVSGPKHRPTAWQALSHLVYPLFDPTSPALARDFPDHAFPLDAARPFLLKLLSLVVLSSAGQVEEKRPAIEAVVEAAYEDLKKVGLVEEQDKYVSEMLEGFREAK